MLLGILYQWLAFLMFTLPKRSSNTSNLCYNVTHSVYIIVLTIMFMSNNLLVQAVNTALTITVQ